MERMLPKAYCCHFSDDIVVTDPLGVHIIGAPHGQGSMDCPKMVAQIRGEIPMDKIIFENEIAFKRVDEPIEEARAREMAACEESIPLSAGRTEAGPAGQIKAVSEENHRIREKRFAGGFQICQENR